MLIYKQLRAVIWFACVHLCALLSGYLVFVLMCYGRPLASGVTSDLSYPETSTNVWHPASELLLPIGLVFVCCGTMWINKSFPCNQPNDRHPSQAGVGLVWWFGGYYPSYMSLNQKWMHGRQEEKNLEHLSSRLTSESPREKRPKPDVLCNLKWRTSLAIKHPVSGIFHYQEPLKRDIR